MTQTVGAASVSDRSLTLAALAEHQPYRSSTNRAYNSWSSKIFRKTPRCPGDMWMNSKTGDLVEEIFLVTDKQLRANRNAALYLSLDLRDKTGVINARMWNVTEQSAAPLQAGGFAKVRAKIQLFQGVLQMIASHVEPVSAEGNRD